MLRSVLLLAGSTCCAALKVTVVGGSGFTGSRVVQRLVESGAEVTAVSKSGAPPEWAAGSLWASSVSWVANDLTRGPIEGLQSALGQPEVLVSCVGAIGFDRQELLQGNGKAHVDVAKALKKTGGVQRVAYVSVSEELFDCANWLPSFFEGYFDGKRQAESALKDLAPTCVVRPTFIYGGESFGIAPPRVTSEYGAFIEQLLSAPPFKLLANVMPGLIKVALRPPVSVDAVAAACARSAMGTIEASELDGTEAINAAADLPKPQEEVAVS